MTYDALAELVTGMKYRPGWDIRLAVNTQHQQAPDMPAGITRTRLIFWGYDEDATPLVLSVMITAPDSWKPHGELVIEHQFNVPLAEPTEGWDYWLIGRLCDVDRHEAMEIFELADGTRPFYPEHSGNYTGPDAAARRYADLYGMERRRITCQ